jgi:hypothetical protein
VSNSAHTGSYTAQATIGSGGVLDSNMYLTKTLTSAGNISFWWSCSGSFFTHLSFYIDGSMITQLSSGGDCSSAPQSGNYSTSVSSGTHTFKWDVGQNVGSSGGTARIDDITVTNAGAGSAALFNGGNVGIGTSFPNATLDVTGSTHLQTASASIPVLQLQGTTSQTADLLQIQNSAGTTLSSFTSTGALQGGLATGSNTAGTNLTLNGGQGTGTGVGGNIVFQYAPAGGSGSTANTLQTACSISGTNGSFSCPGAGASSERFGASSVASGASSVALGNGSSASASNTIAIGASVSNNSSGSVAIGGSINSAGSGNIALNGSVNANGSSISIGGTNTGTGCTLVGASATCSGQNATVLGRSAASAFDGSIAIGNGATTTATNQLVIGSSAFSVSSAYIGNGVTNAAPTAFTLQGTGGSGTDIAGAAFTVAGGRGTGTGVGGSVNFQIAKPAAGTGASLNTLATVLSLSGTNGAAMFQNSANSTTAFQIQNAAGTGNNFVVNTTNSVVGIGQAPTASGAALQIAGGVQAITGSSPAFAAALTGTLVYDSTAGKFYIYDGSAKKEICNKVDASCGGNSTSLQNAYDASTTPEIVVNATNGALTIRDASSAIGANLLEVQNNAGSTTYLAVAATGTTVNNLTVGAAGTISLTGGATGSRPGSPTEGQIYYDTTTKQLLVFANGKWQADRSTATKIVATSATGGTSSAVASQNPDGADFVNTSTSAAEVTIQAAITALPASGGTVYLEEGTYIIGARINIPSNVTIAGSGNSTVLKIANSNNTSFDILGASSGQNRTIIRNLKLDGNKANNSSGTQRGILHNTGDHHQVDHVWATSFRSDGINVSASSSTVTDSFADSNTGYGFSIGASNSYISNNIAESNTDCGFSAGSQFTTYTNNNSRSNTNDGFCNGSTGNVFTGNISTSNSQRGFNLGGNNLLISGNTANSNSNTGINTNGSGVTINANSVVSNGFIGINVAGTSVVSNNYVYDNGGSGSGEAIGDSAIGGNNTSITGNTIMDTAGTSRAIYIDNNLTGMYVGNNNIGVGSNGVWNGGGPIQDNGNGTVFSSQLGNNNTILTSSRGSVNIALTTTGSGSLSVQGGYYGTQLPTPSAPSVNAQGTTGAATYQYKITAIDGNGETAASAQSSGVTNGNATLTGGNFNRVTWNRTPGATSYKIYRTNVSGGSPSSLGLVGTVNASATTMQFDDTGIAGTTTAPTINTTGGAFYSGNVLIKAQADNTSAFMVQNSAGTALLTADTTNKLVKLGTGTPTITAATTGGLFVSDSLEVAGQLRFGDATNNINVDATTHKLTLNGTARNTRTVSLAPEFTNSVLNPDGANNIGSLTSGIDTTAGAFHNYYNWTTTQGTAQDYDMYVRIPVPRDFSAFPAGGQICYYVWTDDSTPSNSVVTTTFYDTGSTAQTSFTATPTSTNTWQQKCTTNIGGTITVNGNTYVTVQFHFAAAPNQNTRIGEFSFDYLTSF